MRRFLLLCCLMAGFLLIQACSDEETIEETPTCSSDDQCAKGMRCLNSECVSLACEADEDCLNGEICNNQQCQEDDGSGTLCALGDRRCTTDGSAVEVCAQGSYGLIWQAAQMCNYGCALAACVEGNPTEDGDEELEDETDVEAFCEPNAVRCWWNNIEVCLDDGSDWSITEECGRETQCQGEEPFCGPPQICGAGMRLCADENTIQVCNEDGTEWEYSDCGAGGTCSEEDVQCHYPQDTCILNRYQCLDNEVQKCISQGGQLQWVHIEDCDPNGTCVCLNHVNNTCTLASCQASAVCSPLQRRCSEDGSAVEMCQYDGMGYVTLENCADGTTCVSNSCQ